MKATKQHPNIIVPARDSRNQGILSDQKRSNEQFTCGYELQANAEGVKAKINLSVVCMFGALFV